MDAAAQKTLQDTVAALQRNDPALQKLDNDMVSKSGRCGAFRGQRVWVFGLLHCSDALACAEDSNGKRVKIGAAGCQAICSALEGNTRVVTWMHIGTLSRVLHAAAPVTCGRR